MSKYEEMIISKYNKGVERHEIAEDLAMEQDLTFKEAEEIVDAFLLRAKRRKNTNFERSGSFE